MDRNLLIPQLEGNLARFGSLADVSLEESRRSYAPGKWTIAELLAHVADCEAINLWRFSRAVAEPGSRVEPFEENDWARELAYASRPVALSRDLFLASRHLLLHHLKGLGPAELDRCAVHAEKGTLPAWRWARLAVHHAEHHLDQVEAARRGVPWKKRDAADGWEYGAAPKPKP